MSSAPRRPRGRPPTSTGTVDTKARLVRYPEKLDEQLVAMAEALDIPAAHVIVRAIRAYCEVSECIVCGADIDPATMCDSCAIGGF